MLEKWIKEVKLDSSVYSEADKRFEDFKKSKELEFKERTKIGKSVKVWAKSEYPERVGGFRGQKWFDEMLFDIQVFPHHSDLKTTSTFTLEQWSLLKQKIDEMNFSPDEAYNKWLEIKNCLEINFDMEVFALGHIEIKTLPFKTFRGKIQEIENVNIKKTPWHAKPSTYLCVLKTCDEEMETFQFLGWLYEHEVFRLPVDEVFAKESGQPLFYFAKVENLHPPETLLSTFLELSKNNPANQ